MKTGLGMLPFAKGVGSSGLAGSSATRVGFRWAGRERQTNPITKDGKIVGRETRVVTRVFGRGTETVERKSAGESSRMQYSYRQGPLSKSWEAHSSSTQKIGGDTVVKASATASGGQTRKGVHVEGKGTSEVMQDKSVIAVGKASGGT